jgi:hypothetical protein
MILFEVNSVNNPEIEAAKIFAGEKGAVMSAPLPENGDIWQDEGERVSFFKPERIDEKGLCRDLMSLGSIEEINIRSCERFMDHLAYIKNEEGMAVFAVSGEKKGVPIGDFLEIYKDNYREDVVKAVKTEEQKDKKEAGLAGLVLGGGILTGLTGMFLVLKNSVKKASQRERMGNRIDVGGSEYQDLLAKRAQKEGRRVKKEIIEKSLGIKKENKREEKIDYRMGKYSRAFGGKQNARDNKIDNQKRWLVKGGYEVGDAREGNEEILEKAVNLVEARITGRRWDGKKVVVLVDKNNLTDREKGYLGKIATTEYGVQMVMGVDNVRDIEKMNRGFGPEKMGVINFVGRKDGVNVYEIGKGNRH